ncbi:MAG: helicase-related protein [Methanomassiliicoccales archaeon]
MPERQQTLFDYSGIDTDRGIEHDGTHVIHPYLAAGRLEYRKFQFDLAKRALERNLLVVIPTGLGKTVIALIASAEMLRIHRKRIVFLAPTRPLAMQHSRMFSEFLFMGPQCLFTGSTPPEKRIELWKSSRVVFATPQVIGNDIENGRYTLDGTSFCIFDEAHRAVGNYTYVDLAKKCREAGVRVLALTASPGAKMEKVEEILDALGIESVEIRDREDTDVKPYVMEVTEAIERVELTHKMREMLSPVQQLLEEKVRSLQRMGFLRYRKAMQVSRKDLLSVRAALMGRKKGGYIFGAMHNSLVAMHSYHCAELLETQGVEPLRAYLHRLMNQKKPSKADRSFLNDKRIGKLIEAVDSYTGISHPKLEKLLSLVRVQLETKKDSTVIVFTQYRDTIDTIIATLRGAGITCEKFIGQSDREEGKGMSQKEQAMTIGAFSARKFNVLVASSIGEEGIDVPDVDLVIFYEPIPSEIRTIQRMGRTGRRSIGKVITLVAAATRDEAFHAVSHRRVAKMRRLVRRIRES